ncbi:MAG: single-stranded DNA-binding protein [Candidatus Marinimicrobia bacterium]|nr:single-stranded DNA-binding protein [Candidatus Neomarinimicrobiota bacterium]|tara:strand:- start:1394 stop:1732 length:339 start_codon:yes stop_codon:yes gene_type:complete
MQKNSLNKVLLVGRLGAEPEARYTSAGIPVVSFSLATNELWKQKNGEFAEKVEWHNIVIWDKLAEAAQKSLSKGLLVSIEGKLQTRSWENKDGQKLKTTEIVCSGFILLEKK